MYFHEVTATVFAINFSPFYFILLKLKKTSVIYSTLLKLHVMGKGIIVKVSVENVMCLFKTKEPSDEGWFFEFLKSNKRLDFTN
ncbi:hypothetical protein BJI62_06970 [Acinetobacter pittii]|nr:hypothetical protein BJI62_06970 [Acinetobacter pittii]